MEKLNKNYISKSSPKRYEILITGMGGEGVVLAGEILGLAASLDGKFASQRSIYGAAQRGEALCSQVIISENPVQYTFIESPTFLISFSQHGFDAYYKKIIEPERSSIFIDSTHKFDLRGFEKKAKIIRIEAHRCAIENNIPMVGNIIMLSCFSKITGIVTELAISQAIRQKIPIASQKPNLDGMKLGEKLC